MAYSDAADSYGVQLATKLQMILDQPMSDIMTKLVNRDFEGDFFKIGDTVRIVRPDPSAITTSVSDKTDARLDAADLEFAAGSMQIDKSARYAFLVSDVTDAEGKWNYESMGLALAGHDLRQKHNVELCDLIVNDTNVIRLGSPSAPIDLTQSGKDLYKDVLVPIFTKLYAKGAIAADGTVPVGSNPVEGKAQRAGLFVDTNVFGELLKSPYLTDRSTTQADEKIATASIGKVLGMEVGIEEALNPSADRKITINPDIDPETEEELETTANAVIIAGTSNCVTKANKVLPPDRFRSHTRFADEFHGLEIYGQEVLQPKCAVVAFVKGNF